MNQAVSVLNPNQDLTPEQIKLITDTVAKGASSDELRLFLYRCKTLGLDPLKPGQIYFIKYGTGPGSIVVGIEGFRAKAVRTGKLAGINRGVTKNDKGVITGAWAEVSRKDWSSPAREEVPMSEYNTGKGTWAKMPETMIKKVAEAAALRMAFPDDLGGIYIPEEEAALESNASVRIVPQQPDAGDGFADDVYRVPGGAYVKRTIEQIVRDDGSEKIGKYLDRQNKRWKETPEKKPEWWDDFELRATEYIGDMENGGE